MDSWQLRVPRKQSPTMVNYVKGRLRELMVMVVTLVWVGFPLFLQDRPTVSGKSHGWLNLSLPMELAQSGACLEGWARLCPGEFSEAGEEPPEDPPCPVDPAPRLVLAGILDRDDKRIYVIFDRDQRCWIRLGNGETDSRSGISIEMGEESEWIHDWRNGFRYRVDAAEGGLVPLGGTEVKE